MEVRDRYLERPVAFAMTAGRWPTPTPNPRVQRTRAPRFARWRSPLTRHPLGRIGSFAE